MCLSIVSNCCFGLPKHSKVHEAVEKRMGLAQEELSTLMRFRIRLNVAEIIRGSPNRVRYSIRIFVVHFLFRMGQVREVNAEQNATCTGPQQGSSDLAEAPQRP